MIPAITNGYRVAREIPNNSEAARTLTVMGSRPSLITLSPSPQSRVTCDASSNRILARGDPQILKHTDSYLGVRHRSPHSLRFFNIEREVTRAWTFAEERRDVAL